MTSASLLSEPQVLAHTKRRLFPDCDEDATYAVCDTQFARAEWLSGRPVPEEIRERLAPFNHVQIGSGYPDLVGVRYLDSELLATERLSGQPPLIALEAKGYTDSKSVDVEEGLVQAYDRLDEANVVYAAVPERVISSTSRSLARELNVGLLGVTDEGNVTPIEVPRVVGNRNSNDGTAIRFQSTAQGVANKSFSLNHPKNYLAVPLALYHSHSTTKLLAEHVVGEVDGARRGATFLGLIEEHPDHTALTALGEEVVRFAVNRYESVEAALIAFKDWKRSQKRFYDIEPEWGLLTRRVVWEYPATKLLVETLQTMHDSGDCNPSLVDLVKHLYSQHPAFTVELFIRGTDDVRSHVFDEDDKLRTDILSDGNVYHSPTVYQLKAMLFHSGILSKRGSEPTDLDPTTDRWKLREPLDTIT